MNNRNPPQSANAQNPSSYRERLFPFFGFHGEANGFKDFMSD